MGTPQRWPVSIIFLHWIMALAVIGLFLLGDYMVDLDYYDPWYQSAPFWHKSVGVTVLILIFGRLATRLVTQRPEEIFHSGVERAMAKLGHIALYLGLIAVCVSGYLISTANGRGIDVFGWFTLPALPPLHERQEDVAGQWHEWIANGLLILAGIHTIAALKHHWIDRDATLKRMLGFKS